ncbi:MAG: hypothetical protein FD163_145 [Hyphomonadaceae bacterium]|nr:MAG: hypothetical protein FD128_535 [Hyphomonadaceae bacterium]KAF0186870.1 MAG: hypothetical protein FD163_145 [Hyphomonadaceae bacterium]
MIQENPFSGQIILIGTVVSEGFNPKVAKGCRCAMISVVDCDELDRNGQFENYLVDEGLDAGALLDATLGQFGWCDIRVKNVLPIAPKNEGWEPEIAALIKTAKKLGIAHMVFEPYSDRPLVVH